MGRGLLDPLLGMWISYPKLAELSPSPGFPIDYVLEILKVLLNLFPFFVILVSILFPMENF